MGPCYVHVLLPTSSGALVFFWLVSPPLLPPSPSSMPRWRHFLCLHSLSAFVSAVVASAVVVSDVVVYATVPVGLVDAAFVA